MILTPRGAVLVLAALELARREQARDGGAAMSADAAWLLAVCKAAAAQPPGGDDSATTGRRFTARMPASGATVNVAEAAAIAGVSAQAVRKAIRAGRLPAQRHGSCWLLSETDVRQMAWRRQDGRTRARTGRAQ